MTSRTYCFACGDDCTHAYATYQGYPHHFGCLPAPKKGRRPVLMFEDEALAFSTEDDATIDE